ncbi:MAG: site-specific integrase [Clostridia bacterium]|nr:site-specific integrase [Clostridia bacterium]
MARKTARKRQPNNNGSVYYDEKRGKYRGQYPYTDPKTGRKTRKSVSDSDTEAEAWRKIREKLAAIDAGTYFEPEKMPLQRWLDIWTDEYLIGVKAGTVRGYKSNIRLHIAPALGTCRLNELRPHDVQQFVNSLSNKGLVRKTVKNIHGTLHRALDEAVRLDYLQKNPADRMQLPKERHGEKKEIMPLEGEQITDFLRAIKGNPSEHLYFVALNTGMRLAELLGLQWSCVDFKKGTIKVDKQLLWKHKGEERRFDTPKNSKTRIIKPPQAVMDTLKTVKAQQNQWRLRAGSAWANDIDLVFTDESGREVPHTTVEHRYKKIVRGIDLPERRFHDLRHTYATESIRLGVPIKTVSEALGHYSVAFTMDVYGHVTKGMQEDAANILQAALMERLRNA